MTRPRANGYKQFVTKRYNLHNAEFSNERNEKDKKRASTKRLAWCAAMTRQWNSTTKKNKMTDRVGGQNKWRLFFIPLHFAHEPRSMKHVKPNGWRYRRLGRTKLGNGKLLKLRTTPKNAHSPSRPVHAVLAAFSFFLLYFPYISLIFPSNSSYSW